MPNLTTSGFRGAALVPMILLLSAVGSIHAQSEVSEETLRAFNAKTVDRHILPRYGAFAAAAGKLSHAAQGLCARVGAQGFAAVRTEFVAALAAWMAIEHIRFGPIEAQWRHDRIHFWPGRRNATEKALARLLAEADVPPGDQDYFAGLSVAGQGLTALERLLYAQDRDWQWFDKDTNQNDANRCGVLIAITANVAAMAEATLAEWRHGYRDLVRVPGQPNAPFPSHREATIALLKSVAEALYFVDEVKLGLPLGVAFDRSAPRLAETRRSGRDLANIRHNFAALGNIIAPNGEGGVAGLLTDAGAADRAADLVTRSGRIEALLSGLPDSMVSLIETAEGWRQIETLRREIGELRKAFEASVARDLDLELGFNRHDGD